MQYWVSVPVSGSGQQCFTVDADSPEEAVRKVKEGVGNFEEEEVTADSLDFHNAKAVENE